MKTKIKSLRKLSAAIAISFAVLLTTCSDDPKSARDNNTAPVAYDRTIAVLKDTARIIELEAYDRDGDILIYRILDKPSHGTMVKININTWRFTPELNYEADDSFKFAANDGFVDSNPAKVTMHIGVANHAPVAYGTSDPIYGTSGNPITIAKNISTNITLQAEDIDAGDNARLKYIKRNDPKHGILTNNENTNIWVYTPNSNYAGNDSFTFYVNDGYSDSNTATISLTVGYTNHAPVANNLTGENSLVTSEDTPISAMLSATDEDTILYNDILTYAITSNPTHGIISIFNNETGEFTYQPGPDFNGTDSFTFQVEDTAPLKSNLAMVEIIVNAANDGPTAKDFIVAVLAGTSETINLRGYDVDNNINNLTYTTNPPGYQLPESGTVSPAVDSQCTYTPNANFIGKDYFYYSVTDGELYAYAKVTVVVTEDGIIYVNKNVDINGDVENDGSCWLLAFKTIQEAVNSLNNAGSDKSWQIWVAGNSEYTPGTFNPNAVAEITNKDISLSIYGGFRGDEDSESAEDILANRDFNEFPTVLSGNNAGHVIISNGTITMDGFTIQDGNADGTGENGFGGGIYAGSEQLTLNNVNFINNKANSGGAIYAEDSTNVIIKKCNFYSNTAVNNGGAIFGADNSIVKIGDDNTIACDFGDGSNTHANKAAVGGAVFASQYSSFNLTNCKFNNNTAAESGGALFISSLNKVESENYPFAVSNSSFSSNSSLKIGGAASIIGKTKFFDCDFTGNSSMKNGGAVNNSSGTNAQFTYCRFTNNNHANENGGAIYNSGFCEIKGYTTPNPIPGQPDILNKSKFTGNSAGIDGGAMYNVNGGSNANGTSVTECDFSGNTAGSYGGAVCNNRVSPRFTAPSNFTSNNAPNGGAICNRSGAGAVFTECKISSNYAFVKQETIETNNGITTWEGGNGGAIYNDTSASPEFMDCVISGNKAVDGGAIFNINSARPLFFGCTISGNSATYEYHDNYFGGNGAAIYDGESSNAKYINCLVISNTINYITAWICTEDTNNNGICDEGDTGSYQVISNGEGIIYTNSAVSHLINCTIADNIFFNNYSAYSAIPVLYLTNNAKAVIINTILRNNYYEVGADETSIINITAKNNCISFYRDEYSSWFNNSGNIISDDPKFVNGYYLRDFTNNISEDNVLIDTQIDYSPCINKGTDPTDPTEYINQGLYNKILERSAVYQTIRETIRSCYIFDGIETCTDTIQSEESNPVFDEMTIDIGFHYLLP